VPRGRIAVTRTAAVFGRLSTWAIDSVGSSRTAALIRIGLVFLIWARFSNELILYTHLQPAGVAFSLCYFVVTTAMLFGLWSRIAAAATAAVLFTLYYYGGHVQGHEPWTHHHVYLLAISTLVLTFTPCGRSYSLDRWLSVRRAEREGREPPAERGNLWGLRLIVVQLSALYFWTAFDKTQWGFLSGARMEQYAMHFYFGSTYPTWPGFHGAMLVCAWIVVLLEYALAFGMPFRRTRRWLILPGLLLHALFYVLLPVFTYSMTMWLLYLAYLDADCVHDVIERLSGRTQANRAVAQGRPGVS
jgi:HTTM domain